MEKLKRLETKITLKNGEESYLQTFIDCRDGTIHGVSFRDCSGYGRMVNAYLCSNSKHESDALIVQYLDDDKNNSIVRENIICFDSDSWKYIEKLFEGEGELLRSFMEELKR
jgi:hypothetical protein